MAGEVQIAFGRCALTWLPQSDPLLLWLPQAIATLTDAGRGLTVLRSAHNATAGSAGSTVTGATTVEYICASIVSSATGRVRLTVARHAEGEGRDGNRHHQEMMVRSQRNEPREIHSRRHGRVNFPQMQLQRSQRVYHPAGVSCDLSVSL